MVWLFVAAVAFMLGGLAAYVVDRELFGPIEEDNDWEDL